MTSGGIRYSNIDPDQDTSTESSSTGVRARPSRNQCETGTSPLAIATKLASRASDARRSYRPGSRLPSVARYPIANSFRIGSKRKPKSMAPTIASAPRARIVRRRSEEHTSELQSHHDIVCRLLLEKKK